MVWEESMWLRPHGTPPRTPRDVRFEVVDSNSIRLSWKRPHDSGPIDYHIQTECGWIVDDRTVPGGDTDSLTTVVTDLPKGYIDYFYITAVRHRIESERVIVGGDYLLGF
jgi:hypothetical protein